MNHRARTVAVLVALGGASGAAHVQACPPSSSLRADPGPGGHLQPGESIALTAPAGHPLFRSLAERGPVLRSRSDIVTLRVARVVGDGGAIRAVLAPERPLVGGVAYQLALTRTRTGFGLQEPVVPDPSFVWTVRAAAPRAPAIVGRLLAFGVGPFLAGYGAVAGLLALRRRRLAWCTGS
jgi:hypothetical protein